MWSANGNYILVRMTLMSSLHSVFAIPADAERVYVGSEKLIPTSAVRLKTDEGYGIRFDYHVQWFEGR